MKKITIWETVPDLRHDCRRQVYRKRFVWVTVEVMFGYRLSLVRLVHVHFCSATVMTTDDRFTVNGLFRL